MLKVLFPTGELEFPLSVIHGEESRWVLVDLAPLSRLSLQHFPADDPVTAGGLGMVEGLVGPVDEALQGVSRPV